MPIEIDILGHSCDVVKLGNLLKTALTHFSFKCIDFRGLSQIFASLTRETLEERDAEISTLPWTQTEKIHCSGQMQRWTTWLAQQKTCALLLSAVTDEEDHPLENEDESGRRLCENCGTISQAREEGPRHYQHEEILRYVQQAHDDINWTFDQAEYGDLLALKKDSAPGPHRIPNGVYRCAGGLGLKFLFNAYRAVLEGSATPDCFAESRTVFIPKTSDTEDLGRII